MRIIFLFLALCSPASPTPDADFSWVVGINYVPSTSHNAVATWQDFDSALVNRELGFAAAAGFNAIRVFLHSLPWEANPAAFRAHLSAFISSLERRNLTAQLVVFDSCFGDVNANLTWISSGLYKNATWIPNPGPARVADATTWPQLEAYVRDVVATVGASPAVFLYDGEARVQRADHGGPPPPTSHRYSSPPPNHTTPLQ